jgi:hypothetical protein
LQFEFLIRASEKPNFILPGLQQSFAAGEISTRLAGIPTRKGFAQCSRFINKAYFSDFFEGESERNESCFVNAKNLELICKTINSQANFAD